MKRVEIIYKLSKKKKKMKETIEYNKYIHISYCILRINYAR